SIIAHEIAESVTDPDQNAWFDSNKEENADKCAWQFGAMYRTRTGASANVRLGSRDFLIQQIWVNVGTGYCATAFPSSGSGQIGTKDSADVISWQIERGVTSAAIVEFRLCQVAALTWRKTLVMRDGTGGQWNLSIADSTKCVTNSLWSTQV